MAVQKGFVKDLVGNFEDRFSHNEAHFDMKPSLCFCYCITQSFLYSDSTSSSISSLSGVLSEMSGIRELKSTPSRW